LNYTKSGFISSTIGGVVGNISGSIVAGEAVVGTVIGAATGYGLSGVCRKIWKFTGPNKWIFLLTDCKPYGSI